MGTRADFYVGRGEHAEWLGSIAWDGYPHGIACRTGPQEHLFRSTTEAQFRARLTLFFENRDDVTLPEHGWPWPWENSHTTDYAYAFDDGRVWASCFGHAWFNPLEPEPKCEEGAKPTVFPKMKTDHAAPLGSNRSGTMLLSFPRSRE